MLKQIGDKTYYIENDTNIGIYMTGPDRVCLIDTGSRGDGEKIDEILMQQGWELDFIINTHTHIDHIGGNKYLMEKYNVPAYCTEIDKAFAEYSDLEASYMNGGKPAGKLRHIFKHPGKIGFKAIEDVLPERTTSAEGDAEDHLYGLEWIALPGHTFGMTGVKTPDDVWFLGDAYLSEAYMQKRSFGYLVDADEYLATLEMLKTLEGRLFVPAHGVAEENIVEILEKNEANQKMLIEAVKEACSADVSDAEYKGAGLDEIISKMYKVTKMRTNEANHALLSSTVKCYLAYLQDKGEIVSSFEDDVMVWTAIKA
ncbi:MAG: MBL fold metallo-hydrolase [Clostridiales bacterium]|nr:MBL fold metallo-hydrolase [Clostridiales bacterium]